jgi:2-phosphosulfolactate phosphatase
VTTTSEMSPTDRPQVFVHLLPTLIPPGSLKGGVAVVVDVLRATTVMVHALANGCEAVIPCGEIDEARAVAAEVLNGPPILGGERGGVPIPGFDLGNSPDEYSREVCEGKTLVMTTTNGTRAILASLEAERVYIASFANLKATADELIVQFFKKDHGYPIHIVCAGTEGFISLEDSLLAGALMKSLTEASMPGRGGVPLGNDEALIVLAQWLELERFPDERPLWMLLQMGRGGQNVIRIGLGKDVKAAAEVDCFPIVAELCRDPLRIVKV